MSETEYPSYAEVEKILAPKIARFTEETNYAEYDGPPTPPIRYRAVVREKGFSERAEFTPTSIAHRKSADGCVRTATAAPRPASFTPHLIHEFKRFLQQVDEYPRHKMRDHIDAFGSSERFYQIKGYAEREGWVTQERVRTATTGRYSIALRLTATGKAALAAL